MTITPDYTPGSPEAVEWQAIRDRNVEEYRHRVSYDRFDTPREVRLVDLQARADQLAADVDEHAEQIAALTTTGWLLFPDVSEHQGAFNWQWVKDAGMRIGAYKATEGRTYIDGQAARNASEIRRLGLTGMCYGFVYWSAEYDSNPALWDAQGVFFAQHAPADFAHAIDVEMLCTGKSTDVARVVAGYRTVYPDHPLMIYTNRSLYASRSKGSPADPASLGLLEWHAGVGNGYYTSATGSLPGEWAATSTLTNSLSGFPAAVVWQFTDHGAVAGQSVDGNGFKGAEADFRAAYITGGAADDMSQADVDAINKHIDAQFGALPVLVARAVHSQQLFAAKKADGSPLTIGDVLMGESAEHPLTSAQAQSIVNAGVQESLMAQVPGMSQAVVDGLKGALPTDLNVDYDHIGQVVATKLDQHLGSLKIVSDAPVTGAADPADPS